MASNSELGRRPLQNWGAWKMTPEALKKGPPETLESCSAAPLPPPRNLSLSLSPRCPVCRGMIENEACLRGAAGPRNVHGEWERGRGPLESFPTPLPQPRRRRPTQSPERGGRELPTGLPAPGKAGGGMGAGEARPPPAWPRGVTRPEGSGEAATEGKEEGRGGSYPHLSAPPAASRRPWLPGVPRSLRLLPQVSRGPEGLPPPPRRPPPPSHTLRHAGDSGGAPKGAGGSERESETERASTSPSRYHQPSNMAPGTSPRARSSPPSSRPRRVRTRSPRARARRRRAAAAGPQTRQGRPAYPLGWPELPAPSWRRSGLGGGVGAV